MLNILYYNNENHRGCQYIIAEILRKYIIAEILRKILVFVTVQGKSITERIGGKR